MRVLWLCNIMLPVIAQHLGKEVNNKEGWLSGTYERLKKSNFCMESGEKIELGVCFPVGNEEDEIEGVIGNISYFGFYENTAKPEWYDVNLERRLKKITESFKPDIVHCFGTEFPHTLAMTKVFPYKDKVLIGLQGLCSECAKVYMAELPFEIQKKVTFRDILKKDSLIQQYKKFEMRGMNEQVALRNVKHVTGRTEWDKACARKISSANYHFMNETLRDSFYEGQWSEEECEAHSIFMSQGDYPLKGLHFVLEAMSKVLEKFPDSKLYVAGNDLTRYDTLLDKIKISGYGKYLRKLIKQYNLQEKVEFLGRLKSEEIKKRYLLSNLYVCASVLENSPNSLGEAMLLGVPALASETGGIPSVFTKGVDGLLFEVGNSDDLANKIIYLFSNPNKMHEYAICARKHAQITHNQDINYQRLLEIYQEIV